MRLPRPVALAVAALALALAGCSSAATGATGDDPAATAGSTGSAAAFPVTVPHAFGSTTVERKPTRIATVSWANHEVPLALGVVPVGMSKATWGDDDGDGVLPWDAQRLAELGAQTPVLFDETQGLDFEKVADTRPDLILATYSGLTKEDYDKLSQIAPTIAYPKVAWGTPWQEMVTVSATAMGEKAEGEQLVADVEKTVRDDFAEHPTLAGKKVLFATFDPADKSKIGFYTGHDTRPGFLADLGLPAPALVAEETARTQAFYTTVSTEQADRLDDVDLVVTYGNASTLKTLQADPVLSTVPAIKAGHVAVLPDSTPLAAAANPSPLNIRWGVERYLDLLADALQPAA
ncbi:iron-siderophore ABC transporter substrate-binding protein [Lapillicoccus jejuensis]|uniref:Iron complex transport system substrate-binding protein n=1 Tax=Lapillicoccus jejuensis TaxID=402171 RepID=A0A542E0Y7_9MICO|nr:iron-siderophore ABC transporter substrate-binding protein [Lapillicoccus jejuensis]TQJ09003.1 iron complex transport system substrate-binding protein [Lapillicoccus jejuensis]